MTASLSPTDPAIYISSQCQWLPANWKGYLLLRDAPREHVTFAALTLFLNAAGAKPSPRAGEGLPIRLPFCLNGRRGWGMRVIYKGDMLPAPLRKRMKLVFNEKSSVVCDSRCAAQPKIGFCL